MFWTIFVADISELCYVVKCNKYIIDKLIPIQAWISPYGSRRSRLTEFIETRKWRWQSFQLYAPVAFTPHEIFLVLYSLRSWVEPGPKWGRNDYVNEKSQWPQMGIKLLAFELVWRSAWTFCATTYNIIIMYQAKFGVFFITIRIFSFMSPGPISEILQESCGEIRGAVSSL
jgi:hypothetical protein